LPATAAGSTDTTTGAGFVADETDEEGVVTCEVSSVEVEKKTKDESKWDVEVEIRGGS